MPTLSERRVRPAALLLGVVCAFVACCVAGRVVSRRNPFVGFQRFHFAISPQALFYPTPCQVRALGCDRLDRDRIAVVIGGSSILRGAGQRPEELWTRYLQEELGDDYRVLNLAMDSAFPAEFGGTAAEILTRDCPRLIFVSNVSLHMGLCSQPPAATDQVASIPKGRRYPYFFWDAYVRELLPPDPEREAAVRAWLRAGTRDGRLMELARGMRVDNLVYSRDLWTTLAYSRFCTVWNGGPSPFTRPRRDCPDRGELAALRLSHLPRFRDEMFADLRAQVAAGRHFLVHPPGDGIWRDYAAFLLPPVLRERTVLLAVRFAPSYVRRLSPQERAEHRAALAALVRGLDAAGPAAVAVETGYTDADFLDCCHLSEAGGRKLAREAAPAIRRLAHRLGYDEGERGVSTPWSAPARPQLRGLTPPARPSGGLTPPARPHGRDDHADRP